MSNDVESKNIIQSEGQVIISNVPSLSRVDGMINKLISLTQDDDLEWEYKSPKEVNFLSSAVEGPVFTLTYGSKKLALVKKQYVGERNKGGFATLLARQTESYYYSKPVLMVTDVIEELTIWEETESEFLANLYGAVSFKVAGLEKLMGDLLSK